MRSRRQQSLATSLAVEPPQVVVVHVLQYLDLTERLQHAALVCRSWCAAAAAATTCTGIHADFSGDDPGHGEEGEGNSADCLARWLEQHGGALQELSLKGSEGGIIDFRIPFKSLTQLQDLTLDECYLHEYDYTSQDIIDQPSSSSSSSTNHLAGLSSLTSLDLIGVAFAWTGGGDALSALTNLRELRLCSVQRGGEEESAPDLSMLLPLQQLTALSVVSYPEINEAGARALAQLTGLRQLSVQHMELQPTAMERFVALTNLTALECSYQRKLLSYMHPDELKTLHAVSEESPPTVHADLKAWLDNEGYASGTEGKDDTDSAEPQQDDDDGDAAAAGLNKQHAQLQQDDDEAAAATVPIPAAPLAVAAAAAAASVGHAGLAVMGQQQQQQHTGLVQTAPQQGETVPAPTAAYSARGPANTALVKQAVEQQQQQQQQELLPPLPAAAASALGPAGLSLVKQELGARPSQQQLQYWQLADRPFDAAELQQLVNHYLMPSQAETLVGHATRSGRARPALVHALDIVQQQYPVLAPSKHDLLTQVQQQQRSSGDSAARAKSKDKASSAAGSFAESPAAVVLMRALRCLQLWETRQVTQLEMPTLLQRLAGVGSTAAAAAGGAEVEEVVDLAADDDGHDSTTAAAAAVAADQLAAFLAGQVDVLLVREQQQQQQQHQQGSEAAAGMRVKDEPLD